MTEFVRSTLMKVFAEASLMLQDDGSNNAFSQILGLISPVMVKITSFEHISSPSAIQQHRYIPFNPTAFALEHSSFNRSAVSFSSSSTVVQNFLHNIDLELFFSQQRSDYSLNIPWTSSWYDVAAAYCHCKSISPLIARLRALHLLPTGPFVDHS